MKKKRRIAYYLLIMLEDFIKWIHIGHILSIIYMINIILLERTKIMKNVVKHGKIHSHLKLEVVMDIKNVLLIILNGKNRINDLVLFI